MNPNTIAAVGNASAAALDTVSGQASLLMLRKTLDLQASSAAQLIQALPQPALATSGSLGTRVNRYA
jgi:hypothetical protein